MLARISAILLTLATVSAAPSAYAIGPAGLARSISHNPVLLQARTSDSGTMEHFTTATEAFTPYCRSPGRIQEEQIDQMMRKLL